MHEPITHEVPPVQAVPQAPQFELSLCVFTQVLVVPVPQRVCPVAH